MIEQEEPVNHWAIYQGHCRLFIMGPGATAMRKCSPFSMEPAEHKYVKIAEQALKILIYKYLYVYSAGPKEILEALVECGYQEDVI